MNKYADNTKK